jgi:hypothetical protein
MKKTVAVLLVILTLSSLMGCFRRSKADVYKKEFDIRVPAEGKGVESGSFK